MSDEVMTTINIGDAAGIVSTMHASNETIDRLANSLEELVGILGDTGGRVSGSGMVSGANASVVRRKVDNRRQSVPAQNDRGGDSESGSRFEMRQAAQRRDRRDEAERQSENNEDEDSSNLLAALRGFSSKRRRREENSDGVVQGFLDLDNSLESMTDMLTGNKGHANDLTRAFDGLSSRVQGLSEGLGGAIPLLSRFASALGVASTAMELIGAGIDIYQSAKDVSMSQTGRSDDLLLGAREWFERQTESLFSGLSEKEAGDLQANLIANRMAFGSDEYQEGYRFSQAARLNYGIEVEKAANLYTSAVYQGEQSVKDLNNALAALSETAQESDATMSEMVAAFEQAAKKLSDTFGEQSGVEVATDLATMGLEGTEIDTMSGLIAKFQGNSQYGSVYTQMVQQYMDSGDMSKGGAYSAAAMDMLMGGYGGQTAQSVMFQPLGDTGWTFANLYQNARETGDWDTFERVLREFKKNDEAYYDSWAARLKQSGVFLKSTEPQGIREQFEGLFSGIKKSESAELLGENARREYERMTAIDDSTYYNYYAESYVTPSDALASANESYITQQLNAENPEITNGLLDEVYQSLVSEGITTTGAVGNLTSQGKYEMLRNTVEAYRNSGESSFGEFLAGESGENLRNAWAEYTGMFEGVNTGSEARQIEADVVVKFEGDLGQYLVVEYAKAIDKVGMDNGNP